MTGRGCCLGSLRYLGWWNLTCLPLLSSLISSLAASTQSILSGSVTFLSTFLRSLLGLALSPPSSTLLLLELLVCLLVGTWGKFLLNLSLGTET